jgi:hypothetical protein
LISAIGSAGAVSSADISLAGFAASGVSVRGAVLSASFILDFRFFT